MNFWFNSGAVVAIAGSNPLYDLLGCGLIALRDINRSTAVFAATQTTMGPSPQPVQVMTNAPRMMVTCMMKTRG